MRRITCLILALVLFACGKSDSENETDKTGTPSTGAVGEVADTSKDGIVSFLGDASYRDWVTKQPVPIDSVSAHASKTRTFFNDTAASAAKAAENPLPQGSVIIKEIFGEDGTTLRGQALMAKIIEGTGANSWVWFEGFLPEYVDPYYGVGNSTCTGCHGSGADFVRTTVP